MLYKRERRSWQQRLWLGFGYSFVQLRTIIGTSAWASMVKKSKPPIKQTNSHHLFWTQFDKTDHSAKEKEGRGINASSLVLVSCGYFLIAHWLVSSFIQVLTLGLSLFVTFQRRITYLIEPKCTYLEVVKRTETLWLLRFYLESKVQIIWDGHQNLKKSLKLFWTYLISKLKLIWEIFSKVCGLLRISEL